MLLCRQGHGDNSTTHTPSGTYNPIFCSREPTVAVELKPQNALQTFPALPHHAVNMSLVRICLLLFLYGPDQDLTVPSDDRFLLRSFFIYPSKCKISLVRDATILQKGKYTNFTALKHINGFVSPDHQEGRVQILLVGIGSSHIHHYHAQWSHCDRFCTIH